MACQIHAVSIWKDRHLCAARLIRNIKLTQEIRVGPYIFLHNTTDGNFANLRSQSCCHFLSRSWHPCHDLLEIKKCLLPTAGSRPCHGKDLTPEQMRRDFWVDLSSCQRGAPTALPLIPRKSMNWYITARVTNFSICICLIGTLSRTWLQREPGGK